MKVENLAYPWMKDFDILIERIKYLETRLAAIEMHIPNQKPQQSYQGISNTAGVASGQIWTGGAGGISGQAWGGSSSGTTRIKK